MVTIYASPKPVKVPLSLGSILIIIPAECANLFVSLTYAYYEGTYFLMEGVLQYETSLHAERYVACN